MFRNQVNHKTKIFMFSFLMITIFFVSFNPIFVKSENNLSISQTSIEVDEILRYPLTEGNFFHGRIKDIAITPDGESMVVGSAPGANDNNSLYFFKRPVYTPLWVYPSIYGGVSDVSISSDGNYIIADAANNFTYFKSSSASPIWNNGIQTGAINSVDLSSNGKYFVAGGDDGKILYFENSSKTPLWVNESHSSIKALEISADGQNIAAGNYAGKLFFFGNSSSFPLWNYTLPSVIEEIELSNDGNYLVVIANPRFYLFDTSTGSILWSYDGGAEIADTAISYNGQYIVACNSSQLFLFNKSSSIPIWVYNSQSLHFGHVVITANGEYILGGKTNHVVLLFERTSPEPLWINEFSEGMENPYIDTMAISANANYFAVGVSYGYHRVYLFKWAEVDLEPEIPGYSFYIFFPALIIGSVLLVYYTRKKESKN